MTKAKKVEDSVELFTSDTLKGGAKKPELVKAPAWHQRGLRCSRNLADTADAARGRARGGEFGGPLRALRWGKVLCGNSGPDVDWLVDKFDLDMHETPENLTWGSSSWDPVGDAVSVRFSASDLS